MDDHLMSSPNEWLVGAFQQRNNELRNHRWENAILQTFKILEFYQLEGDLLLSAKICLELSRLFHALRNHNKALDLAKAATESSRQFKSCISSYSPNFEIDNASLSTGLERVTDMMLSLALRTELSAVLNQADRYLYCRNPIEAKTILNQMLNSLPENHIPNTVLPLVAGEARLEAIPTHFEGLTKSDKTCYTKNVTCPNRLPSGESEPTLVITRGKLLVGRARCLISTSDFDAAVADIEAAAPILTFHEPYHGGLELILSQAMWWEMRGCLYHIESDIKNEVQAFQNAVTIYRQAIEVEQIPNAFMLNALADVLHGFSQALFHDANNAASTCALMEATQIRKILGHEHG